MTSKSLNLGRSLRVIEQFSKVEFQNMILPLHLEFTVSWLNLAVLINEADGLETDLAWTRSFLGFQHQRG